jgi:hypothetical protein
VATDEEIFARLKEASALSDRSPIEPRDWVRLVAMVVQLRREVAALKEDNARLADRLTR